MKYHSLKDIESKVPKPGSFKHYLRIKENGGRVVKGVNTTPDVGVNAIKKQAAKFGNKVDKDGRPPTLSKKVRGSKTNVLFNLGLAESRKDITYTKPNLDHEWDEATRYEEFKKIGKDKWTDLVSKGKVVEYNTKTVQKMSNTDAVNVKDFDNLDKNKQERALKQLEKGSIELPIVASYSDGHLELIGGNTRLTALMKATGKGKVWQFDVPDKVAKLAEEKTNEVTAKDLAKESEIYVDMDGVLADFFGAWKKLIGTDWREIKDLDSALQKIRDKDDFWLNIPITKNAMNLLGLIKQLKGKYNILSAPLPNDPNSEPHKREWIKKNLSAFPPSKVIITSNKAVHATQPDGTPNILIDDFGQNVAKWEAAGGVGFKHKDHKFERTVKNLKQHMSEAKMSKSSIKKIHKTADKIKDKPKAKKSISNWAKERGMDPEGAIYAIATNMRKRKEGKKITGLGKESYTRDELPQIKSKHLENFPHVIEYVNPRHLVPVQKERLKENHTDQLLKILEGRYTPIVVDWDYKIINGHHRYDIVKKLQMEQISVARLPFTLEEILENFADGKKKGKSRPGRVKRSGASCKGSVTSLRAKAKKASGERAKMYHWCANMKGGKKKSESYTQDEFFKILIESTPQQLEEGIADTLKKLPKNLLGKVTPIIKKIPKTAKNLTLMAVLLGTMVNAVAAGDMAKVNTPLDKLNNMATMSSTMDDPNQGNPDPKSAVPDKIKILKMPTAPEAPSSDTPDGTNDNGTTIDTTKDGNRTVASGAGTYTFTPDGKLIKYESPKIKGLQQVQDFVKNTVTQDFHTPVDTGDGDVGVDLKGIYDMDGNKLKSGVKIGAGAASVGIDVDGNKHFNFDAGGGKSYKMNTKDMDAAKKTMKQMQKDLNIAKDTSAPYANKST